MTEPTTATRTLTAAGARTALDRAVAEADTIGAAFCICITDQAGEPILTLRMDGAPRLSAGIAADKAYTVAGFNGMPSGAWWPMIAENPALVHGITHTPRLVIFGGGVPILIEGQLVGAIGVSGGSAEEDEQVAQAGADAVADAE